MKFTDRFGEEYDLTFKVSSYANNGNLAVLAECNDGEPYATVTKNTERIVSPNMAFVDTNNCTELIRAMLYNGYIEDALDTYVSGYCIYPLCRFTKKFFDEVNNG